jgi:hypothetical protein
MSVDPSLVGTSGLIDRWRRAVRGTGATAADADLDAAGAYLLGRWSEPQR